MTSSFQGGSFRPMEQEDYVSVNQEFANQQARSLDRVQQYLRQEDQRKVNMAGKDWEKLSEFSGALGNLVAKGAQRRDENLRAQANVQYMEGVFPPEAFDAYQKEKSDLNEGYLKLSTWAEKKEFDWELKERFKNLTPYRQHLLFEQAVAAKGQTYNLDSIPELNNALSSDEYNSALKKYNNQFYQQFGDIKAALVEEHVNKHVRATQKAHLTKWNAKRGAAVAAQDLELAENVATTSILSAQPFANTYITTRLGATGSHRAAADEMFAFANAQVDSELVTPDALKVMGEEQIPLKGQFEEDGVTPKTIALKDHPAYKTDFAKLELKRIEVENKKWRRSEQAKNARYVKAENDNRTEILKQIEADPTKLNDQWFDAAQEKHVKEHGKASQMIAAYKLYFSSDATTDKKFTDLAEALQEIDGLTEEFLDRPEVPVAVKKKFRPEAQRQDKLRAAGLGVYDYEHFEAMAGNNVPQEMKQHSDVKKLAKQLHVRYKSLAKELALAGEENFHQEAELRVKQWADPFTSDMTAKGFKWEKIDPKAGIAPLEAEHLEEINRIKGGLGSLGVASLTTPLQPLNGEKRTIYGTESEIASWSQGFGEPGWSYHPTLKWTASQLNDANGHKLHPLTVLNQLRKTVGLPELGKTDQEILFNRLSAEAKAAVVNNPQNSTAINARAMWEIVDPNPDIKGDEYITPLVPNSKEIDTAAEANGIPKNELAMADYAVKLGLDIEQVKTPGTWEHNQYNLYNNLFFLISFHLHLV